MIIKGSQRGGSKQLADHITNAQDNEHVELHSVRGFVSDTIHGALMESYAVSKGTSCTQHMFSVSLNPPKGEIVPVSEFEDALQRIEKKNGLENQPRIVVFHEKEGRRHAHAVYCRINTETMTAINLPFYKTKLHDISVELFQEHEHWKTPRGLLDKNERSPDNYTHAEYQQAKRSGTRRSEIKAVLEECWDVSDSCASFEQALKEKGFVLAQGDRRSFVVLDGFGKVYSLSRDLKRKTDELSERLGDPEDFPKVEERREEISHNDTSRLEDHLQHAEQRTKDALKDLENKREQMAAQHRRERENLDHAHAMRLQVERQERQNQLSKGLKGLWERVTGERQKTLEQHKIDHENSLRRDLKEREQLIEKQLEERGRLQIFIESVRERHAPYNAEALSHAFVESKHESRISKQVRNNPEHVLSLITETESVFTRNNIAKELSAYIDDPQQYHEALSRVMASPELVELGVAEQSPSAHMRYSTRDMLTLEHNLHNAALSMSERRPHGVSEHARQSSLNRHDGILKTEAGAHLSIEQRHAIEHVTGSEQLSCVVGVAGAGKSTMLAAAKDAWESSGYKVYGAALAGKAAEGLQKSSGIPSKTLASYELSWANGFNELERGDVLVIDEAGMVGSKQMERFVTEANKRGAKLVLVGDAEQLQPINAGAPFRALTETLQTPSLKNVHRQKEDWQKQASRSFAQGETSQALQAYSEHDKIRFKETKGGAIDTLVQDYMKDHTLNGKQSSRLALAHRRADVRSLNTSIRELRKSGGELLEETSYQTAHGKRAFAKGDRLLFTRNDQQLGVKNGMLGTVVETNLSFLTVAIDQNHGAKNEKTVRVALRQYNNIDHGYATTIHKSQGATVDKTFVLASNTMDRHLTYVAMTRHKTASRLYAAYEDFGSQEKLKISLGQMRQKQSTLDFFDKTSACHQNSRLHIISPAH